MKWHRNIHGEENVIHQYYRCDVCSVEPIIGVRYHCLDCPDYDLCGWCNVNQRDQHDINHKFEIILKDNKEE